MDVMHVQIKAHPFFKSIDWDALDRREIPPPWRPTVADEADVRNIASEFTNEPAAVTPSPAHSKLRDMTGSTPPSFTDFTFTHNSILDGQTYRVSFADEEDDGDEGMVRDRDVVGGAISGTASDASAEDEPLRTGSDDCEPVLGAMDGLGLSR
ncbi:hypothetical protein EON66_07665 [archaeon]|nr:MAG: hypothetical protein EON66_07665 [archaeon]